MLQRGIEVVREEAAHEAKKLIKALTSRRGGMIRSIVPFAETPGAVARRPERLGDRHLRVAHDFLVVGDTGDAGAQRVASGEQARARGRTKWANLKLFEAQALACKTIEVGRFEQRVPMQGKIAVALVVGENQEDVGFLRGYLGGVQHGQWCE